MIQKFSFVADIIHGMFGATLNEISGIFVPQASELPATLSMNIRLVDLSGTHKPAPLSAYK